ncbi:NYN domain-containing protein [Mycobacterium sp. HUMS_1102779]|uniref:NYN domain-containing protein n=1 Tax=Mycobacterium sp. HUMS_1102779 TaxID=3383487 RepID=UPI00389A09A7
MLPRTLHLIDLENLCPDGRVTTPVVRAIWDTYTHDVGVYCDDGVVVGVGISNAETAFFALPNGIRRVVGRGVDGADLALLGAGDLAWVQRRFQRVVIASGDHIFAPRVRKWTAAGLKVELVLGAGKAARVLTESGVPIHRLAISGENR